MTTTVQARIDEKTKKQAMEILRHLHISLSEAIAVYLKQIVYNRGIPFEIKLPNEVTLKAINQLESGKGASFNSVDEMLEDLET